MTTDQLRALVVDDSAVVRELIAVNLELEGFVVTCASDGEAALRAVGEVVPHVITLDVMMPRLDGIADGPQAPRGPGDRRDSRS